MKIFIVVKQFQEVIEQVTPFVGSNAKRNAMNDFKEWTGVDYEEYEKEDNKERMRMTFSEKILLAATFMLKLHSPALRRVRCFV